MNPRFKPRRRKRPRPKSRRAAAISASSSSPATAPFWELCLVLPGDLCDDVGAALIDDGAWGVETLSHETPPPPGTSHPSHRPVLSTIPAGSAVVCAAYDGRLSQDELRSRAANALSGLGLGAPRVTV